MYIRLDLNFAISEFHTVCHAPSTVLDKPINTNFSPEIISELEVKSILLVKFVQKPLGISSLTPVSVVRSWRMANSIPVLPSTLPSLKPGRQEREREELPWRNWFTGLCYVLAIFWVSAVISTPWTGAKNTAVLLNRYKPDHISSGWRPLRALPGLQKKCHFP